MAGKKSPARDIIPLAQHGIFTSPYAKSDTYPEKLRNVFGLIHDSKYLREDKFGARRASNGQDKFQTKAAHHYDMNLKVQADELKRRCRDEDMVDAPESRWVSKMESLVFSQLDRMEEEDRDFHLCFVCRRFYQPNSRPLINTSGTKGSKSMQRGESRKVREDLEICEVEDRHFNLPNTKLAPQLSYYDDEKSRKTPDVTIGLHTYRLDKPPWKGREDLLENDRIKLFDGKDLDDILGHFGLKAPYEVRRRVSGITLPMFAFGLWEAKKSTDTDTHQGAMYQTALKLRSLLEWQRKIYDKAECPGCPLVWFFSSVGPSWEVVGCYEEPRSTGDYNYSLVKLWYGNLDGSDAALQLLYVIDIIKIWVEHTYKPAIGSCISRLKTMKNNEPLVALKDTLWKAQIAIDRINFPWLFDPDDPEEMTLAPCSITDEVNIPLVRDSLNRDSTEETVSRRSPNGPTLERPPPQSLTRATTPPVAERYKVSELHDYVWLLDRDPRHKRVLGRNPAHEDLLDNDPGCEDLLILRVNESGKVLQPIVIFGSADWDDPEFKKILIDERQRHTPRTKRRFRVNSKGHHYLWKAMFAEPNCFSSEEQFCVILPLKFRDYESQCLPSKEKNRLFEPLETKLGIVDLIWAADDAYKRWCECGRFYDNISPDMILCDNVKCSIGWYHSGCVGLDEDPEPGDFWLCDTCNDLPSDQRVSAKDMDMEYGTVAERSSYRVHRTRTLSKVWDDHDWPSEADVLETFDEIARNLDIVSSVEVRVPKHRDYQDKAPPSNWVLAKDKPEKLIMAVSRKRHLVYHQEITIEEADDSLINPGDNEYGSSDSSSTGHIENELESISVRGKPDPSGSKNPFGGPSGGGLFGAHSDSTNPPGSKSPSGGNLFGKVVSKGPPSAGLFSTHYNSINPPGSKSSSGGNLFDKVVSKGPSSADLFSTHYNSINPPGSKSSFGGNLFGKVVSKGSPSADLFSTHYNSINPPGSKSSSGGNLFGKVVSKGPPNADLFSTHYNSINPPGSKSSSGGNLFDKTASKSSSDGNLFDKTVSKGPSDGGLFDIHYDSNNSSDNKSSNPFSKGSSDDDLFDTLYDSNNPSDNKTSNPFGKPFSKGPSDGDLFNTHHDSNNSSDSMNSNLFGKTVSKDSFEGDLFGTYYDKQQFFPQQEPIRRESLWPHSSFRQ